MDADLRLGVSSIIPAGMCEWLRLLVRHIDVGSDLLACRLLRGESNKELLFTAATHRC